MTAYDSWLEEPYQSSWEEEDDPRMEYCQDEYMTNEEIMESLREAYLESQYARYCANYDEEGL